MSDPKLVGRDALKGVKVAISVSGSDDLSRLGLSSLHCEMAVAELARAIFIAGGTIVYGGRLVPAGFTDILLDEARRYREDREALVICLPQTEHQKLSNDDLLLRQQQLTLSAEIVCLDSNGRPVAVTDRIPPTASTDASAALTGMRGFVAEATHARVVLGGRLRGYQGQMPGVIEEAFMSLSRPQPLYVAGGFGGASCAIAQELNRADFGWLPEGCPAGAEASATSLAKLVEAERDHGQQVDGLTQIEREQLAVTHRPADIASLVVLGLTKRQR